MRRWIIPGGIALALALGCHHEVEMVPLAERTIYVTDRFYDVQALTKDRAFVVGYGGKILETTNGGRSWEARPSGTELALYAVRFADDQHAFISGQDGLILHTTDGGKSWHQQESNAFFQDKDGSKQPLYLFALHALDADHAWAVGDRSILTSTSDGGQRWTFEQIEVEYPLVDPLFRVLELPDGSGWAVGAAGEVMRHQPGETAWKRAKLGQDVLTWLRGLSFSDQQNGWMVGGYGLIYRTTDGGKTWLPSQG